jgi:Flp pilus assembly protein TadG
MLTTGRMSRGSQARYRNARGAVAVELALVMPLLVMLLFGVTSAGLAFSDHLAITNAVREAARLGAAIDHDPTSHSWGDAIQTRVQQVYFNAGSNVDTDQICVELVDADDGSVDQTPTTQGTSCGTAPASPTALTADSCIVKVWVTKPARITLAVFPDLTFTLGAQSVSYYGRTDDGCVAS